MLRVSDNAKKYIESDTRTFHARLLLGKKEVSGEIRSLTINKGACGSSEFVPGAVFSSYIDVTLDGCDQKLEGKELTVQIGTVMGDIVEWTTVGLYTVDKPSTTAYSTSFSGLGRISSKMGGLYSPTIAFPATVKAVLGEISEKTGIQINTGDLDTSIKIETQPSGYLYREMIAFIAGLYFGFATESAGGAVMIRQYQNGATVTTDGDRTTELPTFQDLDVTVTGVKVVAGSTTDSEGNSQEKFFSKGTVNVAVSNPFMTQAIFNKYVDSFIGFQYRPATVTISLGDFRLGAFDVLEVTDIKGIKLTVPCMSVVHTFDGGIRTVVTAPAIKSTGEDAQAYRGPLSQAVSVMQAQLLIVGSIAAKSLTVDQADIRYASIDRLAANEAEIKKILSDYVSTKILEAEVGKFGYLKANELEAEVGKFGYLKADDAAFKYVNIDFSNIDKVSIGYFFAKSGLIENLVVSDQTITGELVGVTIKGDIIEGNTVAADKLVIKGEDGLYYRLNVNALGETIVQSDKKYQSGLDGSVLIKKSVVAEKIAVDDLVAFGATIGGISIADNSIHSGVKESAVNTTRGFYLGKDGQVAFGDSEKYLRYYFTKDGESIFELYSKNFSIDSDGNAKFSGEIDGATGTFSGNVVAKSIFVGDNASEDAWGVYGLWVENGQTYMLGGGRGSGEVLVDDSGVKISAGLSGMESSIQLTGETIDVKGLVTLNNGCNFTMYDNDFNFSNLDPSVFSYGRGFNKVLTNLLQIDLNNQYAWCNRTHYFGSEKPSAELQNSPYTAGPFYGVREVRWNGTGYNNAHLATVIIHEQYPKAGRMWCSTYNKNVKSWSAWRVIGGRSSVNMVYDSWITSSGNSGCTKDGGFAVVNMVFGVTSGIGTWTDLGIATIGVTASNYCVTSLVSQNTGKCLDCFMNAGSTRIQINGRASSFETGDWFRGQLIVPID